MDADHPDDGSALVMKQSFTPIDDGVCVWSMRFPLKCIKFNLFFFDKCIYAASGHFYLVS